MRLARINPFKKYKFFKIILLFLTVLYALDYLGIFIYLRETNFDYFHYPYDGDIKLFVQQLRNGEKPIIPPINVYNFSFRITSSKKCLDSLKNFIEPRLVFVIKSSPENFERRKAIRNTWAYEKRFSDVIIRTVFLLGIRDDETLLSKIDQENEMFEDIVQANFIDTYFNNTIKTMVGFKWVKTYCPNSNFYMFSDDDMYVSTKNVLRFIRNPVNYPQYLIEQKRFKRVSNKSKTNENSTIEKNTFNYKLVSFLVNNLSVVKPKNISINNVPNTTANRELEKQVDYYLIGNKNIKIFNNNQIRTNTLTDNYELFFDSSKEYIVDRFKRDVYDYNLPKDVQLYAGQVFKTRPLRGKFEKWYIDLDEYPYDKWPPYITAGGYILSKESLIDLYYGSFYTKHFRFDDIYLGLVAMKIDLDLYHSDQFYNYKKKYFDKNNSYKYVISCHGYDDPNELLRVWNEQRSLNNA